MNCDCRLRSLSGNITQELNLLRIRMLDQKSNSTAVMRGDRQNYTRSPCKPVTHLLSHVVKADLWHLLKRIYKQNIKKIWDPLFLFLYEPVPNVKYRTEACLRSATISSRENCHTVSSRHVGWTLRGNGTRRNEKTPAPFPPPHLTHPFGGDLFPPPNFPPLQDGG